MGVWGTVAKVGLGALGGALGGGGIGGAAKGALGALGGGLGGGGGGGKGLGKNDGVIMNARGMNADTGEGFRAKRTLKGGRGLNGGRR